MFNKAYLLQIIPSRTSSIIEETTFKPLREHQYALQTTGGVNKITRLALDSF